MAYMAANRLNVFGSLGGKEIREAGLGNLGLQDRGYPLYRLTSWDSCDHLRTGSITLGQQVHPRLWRRPVQGYDVSSHLSD